jgi:hypothetical protein
VFPVTYRPGRSAHLDVGGQRGEAIRRALEEQLGLVVADVTPFGLAGSAGSTPLRLEVRGDPRSSLFGKLYAENHLRADRWYKIGRELLYGRLEDEKPFHSVRRLVQQEDYALRLFRDSGLATPRPYGVAELTPEREYLLVTEFCDGAVELGEVAVVEEELIDSGLRMFHRWMATGRGRWGSSRMNSPCRSRSWVRSARRSWDGSARPRAAAKASPMSSTVNCCRARAYTCSALLCNARHSIMLARSTACRHGVGRSSAKATSISSIREFRTSRFEGLMSRCASPASHSWRTIRRVALWVSVLFGLFVVVQSRSMFTLDDTSTGDLRVRTLSCRDRSPLWLTAQSVPTASLLPCVLTLPAGWRLTGVTAERGSSTYRFGNDRAGDSSLRATLAASCRLEGATEVDAPDSRIRRFQRVPSGTGFETSWQDALPGGCLHVRLRSGSADADVNAQVAGEAPLILGFVSRSDLARALSDRSNGRLQLDSAVRPR